MGRATPKPAIDFQLSPQDRRKLIAAENDRFRRGLLNPPRNCRVHATQSVATSPDLFAILQAVVRFHDFNADNDPHGEHDFGKITIEGTDYFFKIDYYDAALEMWSDPLDVKTIRVLTIMRADEY